jgi:hypothetical protein
VKNTQNNSFVFGHKAFRSTEKEENEITIIEKKHTAKAYTIHIVDCVCVCVSVRLFKREGEEKNQ